MENKTINLALVKEVAQALHELKDQMVFVGGATISLYTDDPAAGEIRPTSDIDMTIRMSYTYGQWASMQERLAQLGFSPDPDGHAMCSYKFKDISIDIMPSSDDSHMGPANRWYQIGFENIQEVQLDDQTIQILTAPCFLATKFEAFKDRGGDYRTSHDYEDIIYVLDNRLDIVNEIRHDDPRVKVFLQEELRAIMDHVSSEEILSCHIHPLVIEGRLPLLKEKINHILNQQQEQ